jgi:NADH dehydrogenase
VAELGRLHFHGWLGWMMWLFVHLIHIVQFQSRVLVLVQWGWNYFTRSRGARLITGAAGLRSGHPTPAGSGADHPPTP